ncbi:Aste57867_20829 [Aphanomyces stellatus]|uniref:Aste57867_20829 protein n=1 Tax=Aphanomyces stellatus TaxID=120398 RepID=A0A485LG25_9STRA|nr:hypothetical protein As57867_020761 [Aphanomyces stellatus]VFT97508.1 Aste57867_20829 [Aphanomyces stellatus]
MQLLEWHFHTYFDETDPAEVAKAVAIRNALVANLEGPSRAFVAVPLHHYVGNNTDVVQPRTTPTHGLNMKPVGPHPIGSFETWVPVESFAAAYAWFTLHRNGLHVLVHPLSVEEIIDHSDRAAWMGTPQTLDFSALQDLYDEVPLQNPHFQLGYSNPNALSTQ